MNGFQRMTLIALLLCASMLAQTAFAATPYSQSDMNALIQIDTDMDVDNVLNWHDPADNSNPGDGGDWFGVVWEDGRVVSIGIPEDLRGRSGKYINQLTGSSDGFRTLSEVRELHLSGPIEISMAKRVGFTDLGALAALEKLEVLEILGTRLTDLHDLGGLPALRNLKIFSASNRDAPST